MGNETSDFEEHFYKLYNFVTVVEDPYFKAVKVYRKNRYNFTHIMVAEQPVAPLPGTMHHSAKALIVDKLALIRRFQSRHTVQLEYFHLLEGTHGCRQSGSTSAGCQQYACTSTTTTTPSSTTSPHSDSNASPLPSKNYSSSSRVSPKPCSPSEVEVIVVRDGDLAIPDRSGQRLPDCGGWSCPTQSSILSLRQHLPGLQRQRNPHP